MARPWLMLLMLAGCEGGEGTDEPTDTVPTEEDPYADLPAPAPPGTYAGTCPAMDGRVEDFESGGLRNRTFIVHLPKQTDGAGVLFLWHGNGDSAESFDGYLDGASLAKELKVITVVPDAGAGGLGMDWAVPPNDTTADEAFFDDVLACLHAQYTLDLRRVYSAGFSMGALWTSWLVMNRGDQLAAAVIFSGGSDGQIFGAGTVNPYRTPASLVPVVMTQGGPQDQVVVNFQQMTQNMSRKLREDGHTAIVCNHTQGHTPPSGFQSWAWPFLDAHVYGVDPSPYADGADPSGELPGSCVWD
jgi:poly(3-hydroxybutyrate) depolymerase